MPNQELLMHAIQSAATSPNDARGNRWAFLDGQEALDALALGGQLGSIVESAGLSRLDQDAGLILAAWTLLSEVGGAPSTAIESERRSWSRVDGQTVETTHMDPFWASFIADRHTGVIYAIVSPRAEQAALHEQRRVIGKGLSLRWSADGQPFDSIRAIAHADEPLKFFKEFYAEATKGGSYSLAFALSAWEAAQIAAELPSETGSSHKNAPRL